MRKIIIKTESFSVTYDGKFNAINFVMISRKDIGYGKVAVFLLPTHTGTLESQTILVEMKIACYCTPVMRSGMITHVMIPSMSNLCVKFWLEESTEMVCF